MSPRQHLPSSPRIKAAGYDGVEMPIFEGDAGALRAGSGGKLADEGLAATAVGRDARRRHNPISADPAERARGRGASRLAARLRHRARGRGAVRAVPPAARRLQRPRADRGGARAAGRGAPGDGRPGAGADAGDRAAQPVRMLRPEHQRAGGGARRAGGAAELRLSLRHLPLQHRGARPGRRRSPRPSRRSATSTSRRTTAARRAPATSTMPRRSGRRRRAGYDGWFTVEAFGQALPDLAAATRVWRPLFDSEDEVVDGRRAGDPRRLGELTRERETMSDDEARPHPARHGRRRQGRLHRRGAPHRRADRRRVRAGRRRAVLDAGEVAGVGRGARARAGPGLRRLRDDGQARGAAEERHRGGGDRHARTTCTPRPRASS